jgi:hypothetical protein
MEVDATWFLFNLRLYNKLEHVEFRPALKSMIWLTFLATLITDVGFSFHVPHDFFMILK